MFFCTLRKNISWTAVLHEPVHIHKGSGSHVDFCPCPCSSTCRWVRFSIHRHSGPHSVCNPCSRAHFGHVTAACHRQKDSAAPIGSQMQQDMDIFLRRLHILGAPLPLSFTVHLRKPRYKKLAIVSPETWLSFFICYNACFPDRQAHLAQWSSNMTNGTLVHKGPCSRM